MRLQLGNINGLLSQLGSKKLVCYGGGGILRWLCFMYEPFGFAERIDFVADSNAPKLGNQFRFGDTVKPLNTLEYFLAGNEDDFVILITTGAFYEVYMALSQHPALAEVPCYVHIFLTAFPPTYRLPIPDCEKIEQQIPKVIHYCWFGGKPIPSEFRRCMESWRKYCPGYEIVEWNESNYDITQNTYMQEAYRAQKWGFVPDYARLDILYRHGGIYLDTDVELVKPLDQFLYYPGYCGMHLAGSVNLGLGFGARPGHRLIREWRDHYDGLHFTNDDGTYNLVSCAKYQNEVLKKYGFLQRNSLQEVCDMTIFPTDVFSPINATYLFKNMTENTCSIHHYASTWFDDAKMQDKKSEVAQAQEILDTLQR